MADPGVLWYLRICLMRLLVLVVMTAASCTRGSGGALPEEFRGRDSILVVQETDDGSKSIRRKVVRRRFEPEGYAVELPAGWEARAHVYDCNLEGLVHSPDGLPAAQNGDLTAGMLEDLPDSTPEPIRAPIPHRSLSSLGSAWTLLSEPVVDAFDLEATCPQLIHLKTFETGSGTGAMDVLQSGNLLFVGDDGFRWECVSPPCPALAKVGPTVQAVGLVDERRGWYIDQGGLFEWPSLADEGIPTGLVGVGARIDGARDLEVNQVSGVASGFSPFSFSVPGMNLRHGADAQEGGTGIVAKNGERLSLFFRDSRGSGAFAYIPCTGGCECTAPFEVVTMDLIVEARTVDLAVDYGTPQGCVGNVAVAADDILILGGASWPGDAPIVGLAPWRNGVVFLSSAGPGAVYIGSARVVDGHVAFCSALRTLVSCEDPELEASEDIVYLACGTAPRTIHVFEALSEVVPRMCVVE